MTTRHLEPHGAADGDRSRERDGSGVREGATERKPPHRPADFPGTGPAAPREPPTVNDADRASQSPEDDAFLGAPKVEPSREAGEER